MGPLLPKKITYLLRRVFVSFLRGLRIASPAISRPPTSDDNSPRPASGVPQDSHMTWSSPRTLPGPLAPPRIFVGCRRGMPRGAAAPKKNHVPHEARFPSLSLPPANSFICHPRLSDIRQKLPTADSARALNDEADPVSSSSDDNSTTPAGSDQLSQRKETPNSLSPSQKNVACLMRRVLRGEIRKLRIASPAASTPPTSDENSPRQDPCLLTTKEIFSDDDRILSCTRYVCFSASIFRTNRLRTRADQPRLG